MSYEAYAIDAQNAKTADQGGRIEHSAKLVGQFKSVEFITSNGGAQGFEFRFETDSKQSTNFTIWTKNKAGEWLQGRSKIDAIMACASVRNLTPTKQKIEKYDYDEKKNVMKECIVAPELMNVPIGLLLQREQYQNDRGEDKHQMILFSSFNAKSELTAKEIIDRATVPEELPRLVERLMSKPIAYRKPQNNAPQGNQSQPASNASNADDIDNLPF